MIIPGDKRVASMMGVTAFSAADYFTTASPDGPPGTSLMSFFTVITCRQLLTVGYQQIFGRYNGGTSGWSMWRFTTTGDLYVSAVNSTPAFNTGGQVPVPVFNVPMIVFGTYNNGTLKLWFNGVLVDTSVLGTGFTPALTSATRIGVSAVGGNLYPCTRTTIHEAGMLDGVDLTATMPAVNAQWQEDLQQGRYLTWPRAMTVNDWYWSARDIVGANGTCGPTWTDRGGNATVMMRTGAPQGAIIMPRF